MGNNSSKEEKSLEKVAKKAIKAFNKGLKWDIVWKTKKGWHMDFKEYTSKERINAILEKDCNAIKLELDKKCFDPAQRTFAEIQREICCRYETHSESLAELVRLLFN